MQSSEDLFKPPAYSEEHIENLILKLTHALLNKTEGELRDGIEMLHCLHTYRYMLASNNGQDSKFSAMYITELMPDAMQSLCDFGIINA